MTRRLTLPRGDASTGRLHCLRVECNQTLPMRSAHVQRISISATISGLPVHAVGLCASRIQELRLCTFFNIS